MRLIGVCLFVGGPQGSIIATVVASDADVGVSTNVSNATALVDNLKCKQIGELLSFPQENSYLFHDCC